MRQPHYTEIHLADEHSSEQWARRLAPCLRSPAVLTFSGEIGAGKTTFIRALLRGLGIVSAIKSPTFSLVETYECKNFQLHHFDLYRIQDELELDYIGFRDYFEDASISCIEWPERASGSIRTVDMHFDLIIKESGRVMIIAARTPLGAQMLSCLMDKP